MAQVHVETLIDAPPSSVWALLEDLAGWDSWNTIMTGARGGGTVGGRLSVKIDLGPFVLPVQAPVTTWQAPDELCWGEDFGPLLRIRHGLRVQAAADGTRLIHYEHFDGWLGGAIVALVGPRLTRRYEAFNQALKAAAEA